MLAIAITIAASQPAYSTNIEYQLDLASDEMTKDEDLLSWSSGLRTISNYDKSEILSPYLKSLNNQTSRQHLNSSKEPEKGPSLSIRKKDTVQLLTEKHESKGEENYSSTEKKNDNAQQDKEPSDFFFKFSIQVKSYNQKIYADDLVKQLRKENYVSFFSRILNPSTKETLYRVFVGRYKDFKSAKDACELLKKKNGFTDNIFVVNQSWVTGEQSKLSF